MAKKCTLRISQALKDENIEQYIARLRIGVNLLIIAKYNQ